VIDPRSLLPQLYEAFGRGDLAAVKAQVGALLQGSPGVPEYWLLLGAACHRMGALGEALNHLDRALVLAPGTRQVLIAKAAVLCDMGRLDESVGIVEPLLSEAPDDPQLISSRAVLAERQQNPAEALSLYQRALAAAPGHFTALLNRGALLMKMGRLEEALENNDRLAALYPNSPEGHFNRSEVLLALFRPADALSAAERALCLRPSYPRALLNRALALADLGNFADAQTAFDSVEAVSSGAALDYLDEIAPSDPSAKRVCNPRLLFMYRSYDRFGRCDWSSRDLYIQTLTQLVGAPFDPRAEHIDLPLAYHALTVPVSPEIPLAISTAVGERYAAKAAETGVRLLLGQSDGRIRVGYLSPDFREHLNAYLARPLFRLHDRDRFEVFAYSIGPADDSRIASRIRRDADRFVDLSGLSDLEAAQRINADRVNVLVDLGGYTQHCRPGIAALRPAPVQVSFLGYPGTMGAAWIDYRITDRTATPADQVRYWREKLVFLPDTFFIYDRFEPAPDVSLSRAEYGLPEEGFVFCCFNNYYKIEPEIFTAWMQILDAVPSGVLWLAGRSPAAVANLQRQAEVCGVGKGRLAFAPLETRVRYRARFRLADLFLDTPVFNAMTTACDALAAGLPLLTVSGSAFPSRVAASLLNAVGFRDGIADSLTGYRERAVRWGRKPGELLSLRKRLLSDPLSTPLFDTEARVRQLEAAYAEMWRRHESGLAPESFDVVPQLAAVKRGTWH